MENFVETQMSEDSPGAGDPHAGFTKEQLFQILKEQGKLPEISKNNSPFSWTLPSTWEQKPATRMRVASFIEKADPGAIDCSIVTLGPGAGGIKANIVRWLGQINMSNLSETDVETFTKAQESFKLKNGLTATLADFTTLQIKDPATSLSMIVAIIDAPEQRIFIKMTGTKANVQRNLNALKSLVKTFIIL